MEAHPLLAVAEGGKRAQFSAGKGRIHEEGVLDELALAGELLRLEGTSDEDADENGPLCRTLDDVDHVTHGFSI